MKKQTRYREGTKLPSVLILKIPQLKPRMMKKMRMRKWKEERKKTKRKNKKQEEKEEEQQQGECESFVKTDLKAEWEVLVEQFVGIDVQKHSSNEGEWKREEEDNQRVVVVVVVVVVGESRESYSQNCRSEMN